MPYDNTDPADYPTLAHECVSSLLKCYAVGFDGSNYHWVHAREPNEPLPSNDDYYRSTHMASGMKGARHRFAACAHYDEEFSVLSTDRGREYARTRALFGFFMNGLSSLECACHASYMIGSMLDSAAFPLSDKDFEKSVCQIGVALENRFEGGVGAFIKKTVESTEYKEWYRMRILLFHRAEPPLKYFMSGERHGQVHLGLGALAPVKRVILEERNLEPSLTHDLRGWLAHWHSDFWSLVAEMCRNNDRKH